MIREITKAVLNDHGYRVIECEDGIEGIVNYNTHASEVDLIITDVDMPNMNGAILVETLRKLNPTLKVIGMSGFTGTRDDTGALRAVRRAANAFLAKPFSAHLLLNTVKDVLDREGSFGRTGQQS
jgi:two-component system cell cycle sensor histidine kinase/response regulator CckA